MAETRQAYFNRRRTELNKHPKAALCNLYRSLGGLGGIAPPEKWRKDEVLSSIVDIEWGRLPEGDKLPDPPLYDPPCDTCGGGYWPQHTDDHNYHYTAGVTDESTWVCRNCGRDKAGHPDPDRCPPKESAAVAYADWMKAHPEQTCSVQDCGRTPAAHRGFILGHQFSPTLTPPARELPEEWAYRVDRPAKNRPEGEFMMRYGTRTRTEEGSEPGEGFKTMGEAAVALVSATRVMHNYAGPMTVRVWPRREDEHYRTPPPDDAYRLDVTGTEVELDS